MTADAQISDEEIREWARATNRPVGAKGRIAGDLRAEYERVLAEAAAAPPAAPDPAPPRGPESDSAGPPPARDETQPRRVRPAASRLRARLWAPSGQSARRRRARHPRVSTEKLIQRGWETASRILQPVNLPVARCLDWQAPTAGALLEEAVRDTIADRLLQPVARVEDKLEIAGALIGPPVLIFALQLPGNQPIRDQEVIHEDGSRHKQRVPWPAGAMRQQVIMSALVEALDMCVEAQEKLPAEVRERQRHREQRRKEMRGLVQDVFFAPPPADPAAAAAEEEAMARARERYRGA
ncbi:MAG TPA: hypothetical protein VGR98_21100 [Streptosporangiaceae bacterium]|nr:hypothetical protein [Streptosporangiaceae bacterium]